MEYGGFWHPRWDRWGPGARIWGALFLPLQPLPQPDGDSLRIELAPSHSQREFLQFVVLGEKSRVIEPSPRSAGRGGRAAKCERLAVEAWWDIPLDHSPTNRYDSIMSEKAAGSRTY